MSLLHRALCILCILVVGSRAHATEVVKPPFLIHDNDSYIYLPEDAAFLDERHLLIGFSRATFDSGITTGAGQFFRMYDTQTDSFSTAIDLSGVPDASFNPLAVAGRNGRGRIAYLRANSANRELWLLAVDTDGNVVGNPVRVTDVPHIASADVALLADGTCLVVWWDIPRLRIFGRLFHADMTPVAGEFVISDNLDLTDPDRIRAAFPNVDAGTYFNIAFDDRPPAGSGKFEQVIVVSLNPDGSERGRPRTVAQAPHPPIPAGG